MVVNSNDKNQKDLGRDTFNFFEFQGKEILNKTQETYILSNGRIQKRLIYQILCCLGRTETLITEKAPTFRHYSVCNNCKRKNN
jgi:hypothetical protein